MIEILLGVSITLNVAIIFLLLSKKSNEKVLDKIDIENEKSKKDIQNLINIYSDSQKKQLDIFAESTKTQLETIRKTLEERIKDLNENNSKKLEEMRMTVDEKLHETLEKRLGKAFNQVSERLEKVHKGFGEMQELAAGVGDLKKVLANVKTRGTFGEVQLEAQLEEMLTQNQFDKNVKTKKGSNAHVEFAIKLPGQGEDSIYLPIDSKFPMDKYQYLLEAYETGEKDKIQSCKKDLRRSIKSFAKDVRDKYIDPPYTTDFAIMYLPVEGLYAEVLRLPGMMEELQKRYKILPVGPSNLMAMLNSLRIGFKTLAIQEHSSDVWKLLGAIKKQFGKFGDLLEKTQRKLELASKNIDKAAKKTRYIEGRLNKVDDVDEKESISIIGDFEEE